MWFAWCYYSDPSISVDCNNGRAGRNKFDIFSSKILLFMLHIQLRLLHPACTFIPLIVRCTHIPKSHAGYDYDFSWSGCWNTKMLQRALTSITHITIKPLLYNFVPSGGSYPSHAASRIANGSHIFIRRKARWLYLLIFFRWINQHFWLVMSQEYKCEWTGSSLVPEKLCHQFLPELMLNSQNFKF